jgi:L-aspartate oxidase
MAAPAPFDPSQHEWRQLRALMWEAMGPVRDAAQLEAALLRVQQMLQSFAPDQQTMTQRLTLAEAMIVAALRRRESRGAHWRRDFAQCDRSFDGARALLGTTGANREDRGGRPLLTHCR